MGSLRRHPPQFTALDDRQNQVPAAPVPAYDPTCYLCPGNPRVHGTQNPDYKDVYIFDNDHPVVGPHAPAIPDDQQVTGNGLYRREKAGGVARVVCYTRATT